MRLGNEFCKDLASILTERAEHEIAYSKGLNRTSARLQKLAKDFHGTLSEAWLQVSIQFDAEADAHKSLAGALQEEIVKPLKILADNQIKCRKPVELKIEKVLKNLSDKKTDDYKVFLIFWFDFYSNNSLNYLSLKFYSIDRDVFNCRKTSKSPCII